VADPSLIAVLLVVLDSVSGRRVDRLARRVHPDAVPCIPRAARPPAQRRLRVLASDSAPAWVRAPASVSAPDRAERPGSCRLRVRHRVHRVQAQARAVDASSIKRLRKAR
jgi:hypothetical protein